MLKCASTLIHRTLHLASLEFKVLHSNHVLTERVEATDELENDKRSLQRTTNAMPINS